MSALTDLKTRTRLLLSYGLVAVMIAALGWFSMQKLQEVNAHTTLGGAEVVQPW